MKLCDYSLGPGGSGRGKQRGYAAVTLFRASGVLQQKCFTEEALSDRERERREVTFWHLTGAVLLENEGVNVLGSKAGSEERSRR